MFIFLANQNSAANRHTLGHIVYHEESSAGDTIDQTEDANDLETICKDHADEDLDQIEDVLYTRADLIVDPTQTGVHQEVDKTQDKQDEVGEIEPPHYSQLDKDRQNFDMYDKQVSAWFSNMNWNSQPTKEEDMHYIT